VTWFHVRDEPLATSFYQSGLWYLNGKPKPTLRAFRFPFVALPAGARVQVWGRIPTLDPGRVAVEQSLGGAWHQVTTLTPDRYGVFQASLLVPESGQMRARIVGTNTTSIPFGLAAVPDQFFNPFGLPKPIELVK
jgi:hypothetical protein